MGKAAPKNKQAAGAVMAARDATVVSKAMAKAAGTMGKSGADLSPGAYGFEFTARLSGEATVAKASERESTVTTLHAGLPEIVIAAFSEFPALKKIGLEQLIEKGIAAVKSARRSAAGREKLGVEVKALTEQVEREVRKAKLFTEETKTTIAAGAFRCEPDLTVLHCSVIARHEEGVHLPPLPAKAS